MKTVLRLFGLRFTTGFFLAGIYPAIVQRVQVAPQELEREAAYIEPAACAWHAVERGEINRRIFSDEEIFGVRSRRRVRTRKADAPFSQGFKELKEGDLVVHHARNRFRHVGDVMGDLNARRGRVQGTESGNDGEQIIVVVAMHVGVVEGPVMGAITLGFIQNINSFSSIDTWWETFVKAAIIVVALAAPGIVNLIRRRM